MVYSRVVKNFFLHLKLDLKLGSDSIHTCMIKGERERTETGT